MRESSERKTGNKDTGDSYEWEECKYENFEGYKKYYYYYYYLPTLTYASETCAFHVQQSRKHAVKVSYVSMSQEVVRRQDGMKRAMRMCIRTLATVQQQREYIVECLDG